MRKLGPLFTLMLLTLALGAKAQGKWQQKFEQLGTMLPTPNTYRTASGAPGVEYWQQKADYIIDVEIDDENQVLRGSETITYTNNSPDIITYLWVQLDQNVREKETNSWKVSTSSGWWNSLRDSIPAKSLLSFSRDYDYDGGFKIMAVKDPEGDALPYTINKTMMRIDIPQPLKPGSSTTFSIDWWYNINDRMMVGGRGGYEYFPEDDNYVYTIAQWFPRMAVYDDVNGWQNKQFLGRGEFALTFGDYRVRITVPADHVVASTGSLQNPDDVLSKQERQRLKKAEKAEAPVIIVTQEEAEAREKTRATEKKTWEYYAENVRDFAFATSRKFIWDAMGVEIGDKRPMAMSYYPKEGNPLWELESTWAVKKTLETYSKYTIDYPYPVAISVHAANIGMEYPMICFNFGRPNPDGTYTDSKKYGMISVIIHEVGHNYFPMIINSDERQWTWMDEGLNSFVQYRTKVEQYDDFPSGRGTPKSMINYMKGDKEWIRPIMTNSEQIIQFGSNAYGKPATALTILRETVMGPELFDYAFKEYARRWAFKHPQPADFFRTMEDASGVDLDWFWRGWFYTTDHVDIAVDNVKWYRLRQDEPGFEKRVKSTSISGRGADGEEEKNTDFSGGYEAITVTDTRSFGEFMNRTNDEEIRQKHAGKHFYEVTLKNEGGLAMPVIIEWTYMDGSKEVERIPAEIWRMNEELAKKVFVKDQEVVNISLDPFEETADVDVNNNHFPKRDEPSDFEKFKSGGN